MTPAQKQRELYDNTEESLKPISSDEHRAAILDLLENHVFSHLIHPWKIQTVGSRVGLLWEMPHGTVSVLFGPGRNWEWSADAVGVQIEDRGSYRKTFNYAGEHTFEFTSSRDGTTSYHYYLPGDVEKILREGLGDDFSKEYSPMLKRHEYQIEWVAGRYDGMTSGYVRYKNRLHYCSMVEETELERHRMFAVHHLTTWQRIKAWTNHLKWYVSFGNKWMWKLHYGDWKKWFGIKPKNKYPSAEELYGSPVAFFTDKR